MAKLDITGQRFGRLVALRIEPSPLANTRWRCKCDCGNEAVVLLSKIRSGLTQSCGCYQRERLAARSTIHGSVGSRLYNIWRGMRQRCSNPKNPAFHWYGGRGLRVAEEWNNFSAFRAWAISSGYSPELQIDRADNSQGYSPENCRWVSSRENNRNRSSNRLVDFGGRSITVKEASELSGLHPATIAYRLNSGWAAQTAVTAPPMNKPDTKRIA